jgi:hypothetical protein
MSGGRGRWLAATWPCRERSRRPYHAARPWWSGWDGTAWVPTRGAAAVRGGERRGTDDQLHREEEGEGPRMKIYSAEPLGSCWKCWLISSSRGNSLYAIRSYNDPLCAIGI